jgi:hypothetical protein
VKACCDSKTVGDVVYLLDGMDSVWTGYYGCKDECIYRRQEIKDISFIILFHSVFTEMQLHIGAELFGNVIVQCSELMSKYHSGA